MTTVINIEARVPPTKEVLVVVTDKKTKIERFTLQDGETAKRYVYDERTIKITEKEKKTR